MVTRGKIAQNQANLMVTRVVTLAVRCLSYDNVLHYGLSMFVEFKTLPYPLLISISVRFHNPSLLLIWNFLNT